MGSSWELFLSAKGVAITPEVAIRMGTALGTQHCLVKPATITAFASPLTTSKVRLEKALTKLLFLFLSTLLLMSRET